MDTEGIVRALAAVDEPMNWDSGFCTLCNGFDEITNEPQDYAAACPWRLARSWAESERTA